MGPEEEGFPIMNMEGMQLPLDPAENNLLQLADDFL
jgi:hypothetical protein